MTNLRIMSNNIWWCDVNNAAWEAMGADCSAAHRAKGFFRLYNELSPDIIGLQECSARMSHILMAMFAENAYPYALLWGRDTPIIYRKDKFELVDSESFIYPEEVPGFEGSFNNLKTKSYCAAVFRLKENGKLLIFATTHLWYMSDNPAAKHYQPNSGAARAYQTELLINKIDSLQEKYRCPAVIVGDFNTYYSTKAIQHALDRGFVHAHDAAAEYAYEGSGMHYCYADSYNTKENEGGFACAIDHILVRGAHDGFVRRYERYAPDYYMPLSDHYPAWIDVEMKED